MIPKECKRLANTLSALYPTAIDSDISGAQSHARALDADTKGALRHIHRRVGTTILS